MQLVTRINEVKTSPRKVRIVADAIRNLSVSEAEDALSVIEKRGAAHLQKALKSAVANAVNNSNLQKGNLIIKTLDVNEGVVIKRFHPSTRGRIHPYQKRSSNIRIVLEERVASVPAVEAAPKAIEAPSAKQSPEKVEEKKVKKGEEK